MLVLSNVYYYYLQVFANDAAGNKKFERLRERVGEHNVRMVGKYYTEISFQRMAELLEMPIDVSLFHLQIMIRTLQYYKNGTLLKGTVYN